MTASVAELTAGMSMDERAALAGRVRAQAARLRTVRECPTPADLAARFDATFVRTSAVDLVASRLRETMRTRDGRLVISVPPQEMKTTLLRWAILWALTDDPDRRIVFASYAAGLARTSGRIVRGLIETHGGAVGLAVSRIHADAADWEIEGHRGGVFATGRGSLTGRPADCVVGETAIITEHGTVTAAQLAAMLNPPRVLSWSHRSGRAEWRQVQAARAIPGREVVEVRTTAGRTLRCTADHRIYSASSRCYVAAGELCPGDRLVVAHGVPRVQSRVPALRLAGDGRPNVLLKDVQERRPDASDVDLRALRGDLQEARLRRTEGTQERLGEEVLLNRMSTWEGRRGGAGTSPLPHLRSAVAAEATVFGEVLFRGLPSARRQADGVRHLRTLWVRVQDASLRASKEATQRWPRLLLAAVRIRRARQSWGEVSGVPAEHAALRRQAVLLSTLPPGVIHAEAGGRIRRSIVAGDHLPQLCAGVPAGVVPDGVLRSSVRGVRPQSADDRQGKLALQPRHGVRRLVPQDAPSDLRARRRGVHGMQAGAASAGVHAGRGAGAAVTAGRPPRQPRSAGQPAGESDPAVSVVPHGAPQVEHDTVSVVRRVRDERVTVYDFQVEGNRNFFADQVLVHNCLIIDDPLRDQKEADSPTVRAAMHEWWESVARTRLAPGAPVIVVQTRWVEDDLAGRRAAEGWPLVNIPALADGHTPDALDRPVGEFLTSTRGRTSEDWVSIRRDVGERTWAALYQGRPAPLAGGVFQTSWFDTWRVDQAPAGCLPPTVVVDPADNEGDGDEAGIILATTHPESGKVYLLDDLSAPMTVARWARVALLTCARREAPTLAYEKSLSQLPKRIREAWTILRQQAVALRKAKGDQAAALARLSRPDDSAEARESIAAALAEIAGDVGAVLAFPDAGPRLRPIVARGSKQLRMQLAAPMFETGRAVIVGRLPALEHQAAVWAPGQDSPDRVDAATHAVLSLAGQAGAQLGRSTGRVPTSSTGRTRTPTRSTGRGRR